MTFRAPAFAYAAAAPAWGRLESLLDRWPSASIEGVTDRRDPIWTQRVDDYIAARDILLRALIAFARSDDEGGARALTASLARSKDFGAARAYAVAFAPELVRRGRSALADDLRRALQEIELDGS